MKKFLQVIIVILVVLLFVQLAYFNYRDNHTSSEAENLVNNTANTTQNVSEEELEEENTTKITPTNFEYIEENYVGIADLEELQEAFYTFINTGVEDIYTLINGKSNNKILQLYDTNQSEINEKNIYSADDFLEICADILMVAHINGNSLASAVIDTSTYNSEDSDYTSFNLNFTYKNGYTIYLKICLANETDTSPVIKFMAQTE